MATLRGASAAALSSSNNELPIVVPPASQADDVAVLVTGYNPLTEDSPAPAGWTVLNTWPYSTTFRVRAYKRKLTAPDAGSTVTITNTSAQRMGAGMLVFADCTDVDLIAALNETVAQVTHPGATAGPLTAAGVAGVFLVERSSSPSSSVIAVPSGFTPEAGGTAFGVGNGAVSVAAASRVISTPAGGNVGGGSWTLSNANGGVITLAVAITEEAPVSTVGKTLTTTWRNYETVGNGFTGDLSDLFDVAGQAVTWQITDDAVVAKEISTSWRIRALIQQGLSTTWNVEELPEDPDPDPDPEPDVPTKRVVFPKYKVPLGKDRLFSRFQIEVPQSLVKANGEWIAITTPAQELLEAADAYFIGGYSYLMTEAEVEELGLPPEFVEDIES